MKLIRTVAASKQAEITFLFPSMLGALRRCASTRGTDTIAAVWVLRALVFGIRLF